MTDNNRVVIIEDDPFSRDMLVKLLSRDWRTRVVGTFDSLSRKSFEDFIRDPINHIDTIILDTEVPCDPRWPLEAFGSVCSLAEPPKQILLCTMPVSRYWNDILLNHPCYGGYLVKQEVLYTIPAVVKLVESDHIVITKSVLNFSAPVHRKKNMLLVDGAQPIQGFTNRELEILRLGVLFNHSQRDIADELVISRDWISEVLGSIYEKLQIREIISGEIPLENVFHEEAILSRVKQILDQHDVNKKKNLRKVSWLNTLAFHLVTIP